MAGLGQVPAAAGLFFQRGWIKLNFSRSRNRWTVLACKGNQDMEKIFCPRCGNKLEKLSTENRERDHCPACEAVAYENPVPATAVLARLRFRSLSGGAYVVTSNDHLQVAREACRGGARIVQYRDKDAPAMLRLETARRIREVTREHGALFIVNDQLDIALLSSADGVHLGQEDVAIADARSLLPPEMIIGVSCSSLAEARAAVRQGADYLGVGAVFATPVKAGYPVVGLEGLRRIADEVSIPLAAIGGVNLGNMAAVKAAGARYMAMVREFQEDTAARVAAVNSLFPL